MDEPLSGFETLRAACAAALRDEPLGIGGNVPDLLALAERHRVVPLVAAGLGEGCPPGLRRRALALAAQTVRLEQELADVAVRLSAAGVEFLVLKGPGMARQAYASPDHRAFDDLDLWVESRDLDAALGAMEEAGYVRTPALTPRAAACARRAGIEAALRHPERNRLIEVMHGARALAPDSRAALDVRAAAVELDVGGAWIRTPAPVHALLLASVHGAHHGWDRLGWVADVAGLWRRLTDAQRADACATARRWRCETALGLALRLAADHLRLEPDGDAQRLSAAPRALDLCRRVGLDRIQAESLRMPMIERLCFERDVLDSPRQQVRMMAGWLFTPTMGDIEALPLPAALHPLYVLLRPLRLLRHPWRREGSLWKPRESGT